MKIVQVFEQILSSSTIRNIWRTVMRVLFMFILGLLGLKQVLVLWKEMVKKKGKLTIFLETQ